MGARFAFAVVEASTWRLYRVVKRGYTEALTWSSERGPEVLEREMMYVSSFLNPLPSLIWYLT